MAPADSDLAGDKASDNTLNVLLDKGGGQGVVEFNIIVRGNFLLC